MAFGTCTSTLLRPLKDLSLPTILMTVVWGVESVCKGRVELEKIEAWGWHFKEEDSVA